MDDKMTSYNVVAGELRAFVERIEQLEAEKKDLAELQKEVMAEAKGRGFDTKAIREIIKMRRKDSEQIAEEEAIIQMYRETLGM